MTPERFIDDIPRELARNAFYNTSFTPEKRGEQYRADYAATMAADYAKLAEHAQKGGTLDKLDEVFARYRVGYAAAYRAWLSAHGRCLSSMITGPARFPVSRAARASQVERARLEQAIEYREKAFRAMVRELRPDLRPIMSGDADAVARLAVQLKKLEREQEQMKAANAALRKLKDDTLENQAQALVELGFDEKTAHELTNPKWHYQKGFQPFELTNNNANIRRVRERLEHLEKMHALPVVERESEKTGVRLEDDPPANRVRLFFPDKPDETTRAKLKSNGFRWAPSVGAWQAYRNHRAIVLAQSFIC